MCVYVSLVCVSMCCVCLCLTQHTAHFSLFFYCFVPWGFPHGLQLTFDLIFLTMFCQWKQQVQHCLTVELSTFHFSSFVLMSSGSHMPKCSLLVSWLLVSETFSRTGERHTLRLFLSDADLKSHRLESFVESLPYLVMRMKTPEEFSNCSMTIILFP